MDIRRKKIIGLLCFLSLFALSGCGKKPEEEEKLIMLQPQEETITYSFATAQLSDVEKSVKIKCTYRQTSGEDVSFSESGKEIEKVYVKEGDRVQAGQLLCELKTENLSRDIEKLEYEIARNELLLGYVDADENIAVSGYWVRYLYQSQKADSDFERLNEAIEQERLSCRYRREDLNDKLELQRAQLKQLQTQLYAGRLYAGMDGIVYRMKSNLEGTISEKDVTILSIMDAEEGIFEARSQNSADLFKEGDILTLTISYGAAQGQYEVTPWEMDTWGEKQYFKVVLMPEDKNINVGTNGIISLIAERKENVLSLPLSAVKNADEKTYVYVLGEDNMREVRWIDTGLYGDENVEITAGLSEGEKVIIK